MGNTTSMSERLLLAAERAAELAHAPYSRFRVGAAVGVFDFERAENLIAKGVDVLIVDSAHGHSDNVIETVAAIKRRWAIEVVAGNVATREGCRDLIEAPGRSSELQDE